MLPLNNYKMKYHSLFSTPFERLFTYQLALKGPLCICSDKDTLALRVSNRENQRDTNKALRHNTGKKPCKSLNRYKAPKQPDACSKEK